MENVVSALRLSGMEKKDARREAKTILQKVELWELRKRRAAKLSSGQKQRLSIARALAKPAPILIADEPTGNLDPDRSLELMDLLVKINELGTTVVVVTHEKDLVDHFGKRVVTIDSGRVVNDSVGGYVGGQIHA
jgi:cell division transport system ATP-binding protein